MYRNYLVKVQADGLEFTRSDCTEEDALRGIQGYANIYGGQNMAFQVFSGSGEDCTGYFQTLVVAQIAKELDFDNMVIQDSDTPNCVDVIVGKK